MHELEAFNHFRDLSHDGKTLLLNGVQKLDCKSSSTVLNKGQPITEVYYVISGNLRVFAISPKGLEVTLYTINPGEVCLLSLNCLFNDLLYPVWVSAETDSRVAVISGKLFHKLFQTEPSIQEVTVSSLSTVVFRLMAELEQVHSCTLNQRLANLILMRSNSDGKLNMTQQKMASHLGTSREVVAKLMRELVAAKYVSTARGMVVIEDAAGLANASIR